jgi:hypothetical protein
VTQPATRRLSDSVSRDSCAIDVRPVAIRGADLRTPLLEGSPGRPRSRQVPYGGRFSAGSQGRAVTTASGAAISGESGHQSRVRPGHALPAAKPLSALLTVRSQSRHGPIADGQQKLGKLPYVAHREERPWPSAAVALLRPRPGGPQSREGLEEGCAPACPAHHAACSGVWHDTWADGSYEARSVVTGPGVRISAGREQSSAETRGFLDAGVRGVDLRWES